MKKFSKNVNRILGRAGFTLVELLVVMAILGVLIAVAIAGISIAQRGARDNTRIRDWTSIKGAIEDCYGSNKSYPKSGDISLSSNTVTINSTTYNCNSSVKLQQGGTVTFDTSAGTCNATGATHSAGATNTSWAIGYDVDSTSSSYKLCVTLENGSLYSPS